MPDENQTPDGRQGDAPVPEDNIEVVGFDDETPSGEPQEAPAEDEASEDSAEPAAEQGDTDDDADKGDQQPPKPKSKGVQKRIDELTSARRDAERDRDYWRELAMRESNAPEAPAPAKEELNGPQAPDPKSFPDGDFDPRYIEALAEYRADLKVSERFEAEAKRREAEKAQAEAAAAHTTFSERATAAGEAGKKALELTRDPDARVSPVMAEVILLSEMGVEIAAHLHANRTDLDRIASLPPARQAYEMGLLQAQCVAEKSEGVSAPLRQEKPVPKPTPTVTGRSGSGTSKPLSEMSQAEYEAETNKRTRASNSGWV